MALLAARRPPEVCEAVDAKFRSAAGHTGWVMDAAANYDFGRFGSGTAAAIATLERLGAEGRRLRVLDAGCGTGGQLVEIAALVESRGGSGYLRGVTAETNPVPPVLQGCVQTLRPGAAEGGVADAPLDESNARWAAAGIDLRVYQGFPLEKLTLDDSLRRLVDDRFDLVLCSWTLLHLCDPLGTLLQLRSLLDVDGVLLANGAYVHADVGGIFDAGSIEAMERLLARLAPGELELEICGEPVRWVAEDESDEWSGGEYVGGHAVNLCWRAGGREPSEAIAAASASCDFTGEVIQRVWHLASGAQYSLAAYRLLP